MNENTEPANPHDYWVLEIRNHDKRTILRSESMIERPYLKDFCEKCKNHYLITNDESRCRKIKLGQSDAMCVQVVKCEHFIENDFKE